MKRLHKKPDNRRGVVTVEFAIVAPVIFLMFFGALEFAAVNLVRQTASNAAYEGARVLVVPGANSDEAKTVAEQMLVNIGVANGATVNVEETTEEVTVTVTIPADRNSWGLSRLFGGITVAQKCRLSREVSTAL